MIATQHVPGRFCWAVLATTDAVAAPAFYSAVLGCRSVDGPPGSDVTCSALLNKNEITAAVFCDRSSPVVEWQSFIRVERVDETLELILKHGGKVLEGPNDNSPGGRAAMVADPTGAPFHIWEFGANFGYSLSKEPGSAFWHELRTNELDAAIAFYSAVFRYTHKVSESPFHYVELLLDGTPVAGMMKIRPGMVGKAPHWYIYFSVANCAAAVEAAVLHGGSVALEPREVAGIGYIAGIVDGQGAAFGIAGH